MKQLGIVICLRLNSKRIPQKALQKINSIPIIRLQIERLLKSKVSVCLALAAKEDTRSVLDALYGLDIKIYYGKLDNVLNRFYMAARFNEFDPIIRITGDDTLTDIDIMTDMVKFHKTQKADYTYISEIIRGTDVEIVSFPVVEKAVNNYTKIEHLSYAFKKYSKKIVKFNPIIANEYKDINLSIDYPEDLKVMQCVYDVIGYNDFDIDILKTHLGTTLKNVVKFNHRPKITIYTCVCNSQDTIARTIESVLAQGSIDFEYIICDDGSTDSTRELLWKYINDSRIKIIINEKNIGLAASSNKVLDLAKGEYYIRIDADDEFTDIDSVLKLYQMMELNPHAGICYSSYFKNNQYYDNRDHHMGCAMVRSQVFHEIQFNNKLQHWEGYDFFLKADKKFEIIYLKTPTWIYHQSDTSMSKTNLPERKAIKQELDNKYNKTYAEWIINQTHT